MPPSTEELLGALSQADTAGTEAALCALAAALEEEQDEGGSDVVAALSDAPLACAAADACAAALLQHGQCLSAPAANAACMLLCISLPGALRDAESALSERAAAAACVAAACLRDTDADTLPDVTACVALLASAGTPAARAALRAGAAPHVVDALLRGGGGGSTSACLALWYLTQGGGAEELQRIPQLGDALALALDAAAAEDDAEAAHAAAGAFAHLATGASTACLAAAAPAAARALATHATHAPTARFLAGGLGKLADAGAATARSPAACSALGAALAAHRADARVRPGLLGALVSCADAEAQALALLSQGSGGESAWPPFSLEERASRIEGAGAGLFVASGAVLPGALLSFYPGEVWDAPPHAPPDVAARTAGNTYLAASPRGGAADGSAAAVARAAAACGSGAVAALGARAAGQRANHPFAGAAPNALFLELNLSALPLAARAALPVRLAGHATDANADAELPSWCICLLAAEALAPGDEVLVDYHLSDADAPPWFTPVAPEHALGWP
jgi:hypothetical protein